MTAKWGICVILLVLAVLAPGCRTPAPDLRPKDLKKEEILEPPPGRYNSPELPKAAFTPLTDPTKEAMDAKADGIPQRNMLSGPGGMGGGR